MRIARHGALYVSETAHSKDWVQVELKKLDRALFLEKQITLDNEEVWCVCVDVGLDEPPLTLLEWRDDDGRPIPYLSERLVHRVGSMERDARALKLRVQAANDALAERQRKEADYEYESAVADVAPLMDPMHAACLPRRGIGEKAKAQRLAMKKVMDQFEERLHG